MFEGYTKWPRLEKISFFLLDQVSILHHPATLLSDNIRFCSFPGVNPHAEQRRNGRLGHFPDGDRHL